MAIGTLTRNPPSAVSILVLWPLLLESLIGGLLSIAISDEIFKWMPFQTGLNALLLEDSNMDFGRWGSVGYFWTVGTGLEPVRSLGLQTSRRLNIHLLFWCRFIRYYQVKRHQNHN